LCAGNELTLSADGQAALGKPAAGPLPAFGSKNDHRQQQSGQYGKNLPEFKN